MWVLRGIVGFVLALLLFCGVPVKAETLTGRCLVLDADIVILSGERIGLKGIDAPETTQRCQDAEQQDYPCAQVSTPALFEQIGADPLPCVGEIRDRYKQLLATCFLDDLNVNAWLVQYG